MAIVWKELGSGGSGGSVGLEFDGFWCLKDEQDDIVYIYLKNNNATNFMTTLSGSPAMDNNVTIRVYGDRSSYGDSSHVLFNENWSDNLTVNADLTDDYGNLYPYVTIRITVVGTSLDSKDLEIGRITTNV